MEKKVLEKKDTKGEYNNSQNLKKLVEGLKLKDVWAQKHPKKTGYTFFRGKSAARLDRFYTSGGIINRIKEIEIHPCPITDHQAITMSITLTATKVTYGR